MCVARTLGGCGAARHEGGEQETWGASWAPEFDEDGVPTGAVTDLLYTEDPNRGMEILRVDLPATDERRVPVEAPVLPEWFATGSDLVARAHASEWGYACPLPPRPVG